MVEPVCNGPYLPTWVMAATLTGFPLAASADRSLGGNQECVEVMVA
jgi:hypothetical protein